MEFQKSLLPGQPSDFSQAPNLRCELSNVWMNVVEATLKLITHAVRKGTEKIYTVSSVGVLPDLGNIKIKQLQKQQEERIGRPDSVWFLEGYISFSYLRLWVVFLSLFKINRISVSFFVKKYGLHDCQPFIIVLFLIFWRVRYAFDNFK